MMRLALISDIHGNAVALDAVLADLVRHAVDEVVCLGDVAAGGPQPREVTARLRELRFRVVRGNAEGWLLEGLPSGRSAETLRLKETVAWARGRLEPDDVDFLAALPPTLAITASTLTLFCCHGSPRSDVESLLATAPALQLDEIFSGVAPACILATGHTHQQLLRRHGTGVLINPGSVGLPLGSLTSGDLPLPAWAEYAIVDKEEGGIQFTFCRVPIDVDALAGATAMMPHLTWAADLERRITRWNARSPLSYMDRSPANLESPGHGGRLGMEGRDS